MSNYLVNTTFGSGIGPKIDVKHLNKENGRTGGKIIKGDGRVKVDAVITIDKKTC